jgi:hypothetical protein
MMRSKIIVCFLCLTLLASAVIAQDSQPLDSDRLKKKIEEVESAAPKSGTASVNLIYKRALLRRYDQYASSLKQDIEALRKLRETLDESDSNGLKEIDADIERLNKEHGAVVEKARSLRGEAQESVITQLTSYPTSQPKETQLPCLCLPREEREKQDRCKLKANAEGNKKEQDKKDKELVGVFWCGENPKLNVQELAERVAPILWFSPDEPLLKDGLNIPEKLPGDGGDGESVVYYRISHLMLEQNAPLSSPEEELDLANIKSLTLQYYFYYSKDLGFTPHKHDLESARFDIHFTLRNKDGKEIDKNSKGTPVPSYYVANISRVVGAAHGVSWFDNILDIEKHTSLPMTLFVEEGKHASCPDRNADGVYSPGYDVNHRFDDAWGVRDIMATGEVGGVRYDASKTKPRRPEHLIMVAPSVPTVVKADLLRFYDGSELNRKSLTDKQGYILRPIESRLVNILEEADVDEKTRNFLDSIKKEQKISRKEDIFEKAVKFGYGIERKEEFLDALTVSYRFDGGHGFTFSPPIGRFPIPVVGGFVLPKANVILFGNDRRYSLEAMYAPSAARSIDWYASIGSEWLLPRNRDPEAKRNFDAKFVSEGGIRGRFNLRSFLIGGRVGVRVTGRDQRVVFELGTGAF